VRVRSIQRQRKEPGVRRVLTAARLGFTEQARRPLLIVLLIITPFFFITRAIASTEKLPRRIQFPGGEWTLTTMRDIHGANMAAITVAFLAGLVGLFVMQSARQADRRLVLAGFKSWQALAPRLLVLASAVTIVVVISVAVTALSFDAHQWGAFALGTLLVGCIYGLLGALAGAAVSRLSATYLVLFGAMLDIGIVQNPMFGSGTPADWAVILPGYGPSRVILDASFSESFHAWGPLAIGLGWTLVLAVGVLTALGRMVSVDRHPPVIGGQPSVGFADDRAV
jgi:hypothetical protein